jgi:hypothetical protein
MDGVLGSVVNVLFLFVLLGALIVLVIEVANVGVFTARRLLLVDVVLLLVS